jgi:hypothetical protein
VILITLALSTAKRVSFERLEKKNMEREDKELEDEIKVAGNALLSPPSSVSQLLLLLEVLLYHLTRSPFNSS